MKLSKALYLRAASALVSKSRQKKRRNADDGQTSFLVVSTTGVGDLLAATPAIRAVRQKYPFAQISVMAHRQYIGLLESNPYVDEVIPFDKRPLPILGLLRRMMARRNDYALVLHASDSVAYLLAAVASEEVVGIAQEARDMEFLLTRPLEMPSPDSHFVDRRLHVTRAIGINTDDKRLVLGVSEESRDSINRMLESHGIGRGDLLIGMHPGAANRHKLWPARKFGELAGLIAKELNARIVVTGVSGEEPLAEAIRAAGDRVIVTTGELSLSQAAALIERCSAYVTNDTGNMHMAFALGTPTVALFCPTYSEILGPTADPEKHEIIAKPRTCDPCKTKDCTDPWCMDQITVEEVYEAVRRRLGLEQSL